MPLSTEHPFRSTGRVTTPRDLHLALAGLNKRRLQPSEPNPDWDERLVEDAELALKEGYFLESERRAVVLRAADAPIDAEAFAAWFEGLEANGPGQHDPLFDHLAERASPEEVRWFLAQEVAGEAGFDDLVALTQLRMPTAVKLELARNYWDEMGRGRERGMHGPMLARLARAAGALGRGASEIVWESLAVGNVLAGLAYNRRYAWHSFGALGAVELTAPSRARKVVRALERVGFDGDALQYFKLHATIDVSHWSGWKHEALLPVLRDRPELALHVAEGALMRLEAGRRAFERYRRELGLR